MPTSSLSAKYIGIMSGTSTDGIDAVLVDLTTPATPVILEQTSLEMPAALRQELLALNRPGDNELERAAQASNSLATLYAHACHCLLDQRGLSPHHIRAIGAHGQTVRHAPHQGYTIQLNAPALLAHLTGIAVIADFRSRDVAGGGQGAPLVPVVHQALFVASHRRAILNLGGMGNVSILVPGEPVRGFDTGPANVLLDLWTQQHRAENFDAEGRWAASGTTNPALLTHLINSEPWFALPPPKSTGRDTFNAQWLHSRLESFYATQCSDRLPAQDIQATLQSLTATTVRLALEQAAAECTEVLVCGGGALNSGLMNELRKTLSCRVDSTEALGIAPMCMEALAFAWLAWAHEHQKPAGLPEVTGTSRPVVLGCRYPA